MHNPVGFTKHPVTIIISAVYIGLLAGLLYVHHVVPPAPTHESPMRGINITEAWRDLQELTNGFHPYNSHRNDEVRDWLLHRIDNILTVNDIVFDVEQGYGATLSADKASPVVIFNDMLSNTTTTAPSTLTAPLSVYFEGTNIMVYVRGTEESDIPWWRGGSLEPPDHKRAVLVNAHYDSVSTGFGATDDGVGVVSILQLIKYFTTPGNQPRRGLIALFNNGEEDYLNGARAFLQHPISKLADSFLNLEGAGAGGRAVLFRTTDTEVTKYYKNSPHPFGSVVSADGFKRGLVRSQTDYVIFNGDAGMRGLDVAFMEPRSRYHTSQDSAKSTSKDSLWHMLSAAVATTKAMTSDIHTDMHPDVGSTSVWFDVFGKGFGLMKLKSMFALSVTLLVACPMVLLCLILLLRRVDKQYLFSRNYVTDPLDPHAPDEATIIGLGGWKGFTRFPIAFVLATAAVVGLALSTAKANPYIVYSSPYSVWSMMLSAWACVAWFFLRGASFVRPSALQRAHTLGWMLVLFWVALVVATVAENKYGMASGYFIVIYFAATFTALATCYMELFALPKRSRHVQSLLPPPHYSDEGDAAARSQSRGRRGGPASIAASTNDTDDAATETTSLLSSRPRRRVLGGYDGADDGPTEGDTPTTQSKVFGEEQAWSEKLPRWLWLLQFLLLAPIPIVLVGQIALLLTSSLSQTLADGNSALNVYLCISGLTTFLILPTAPFLHRFNRKVPLFLILVCIGTLVYNLVAFPFSEQNRLKVYFSQEVDIESGVNRVTLVGLPDFIESIVQELPSSQGKAVDCKKSDLPSRLGLASCSWDGLAPNTVPFEQYHDLDGKRPLPIHNAAPNKKTSSTKKNHRATSTSSSLAKTTSAKTTLSRTSASTTTSSPYVTSTLPAPSHPAQPHPSSLPPPLRYSDYISLSANRTSSTSASFTLSGRNTRACKLIFDSPIHSFFVRGAANRINPVPRGGTGEIRLWSRDWEREWVVDVEWDPQRWNEVEHSTKAEARGLDGSAVCLWSEQVPSGTVPALDEARMFAPNWVIVSDALGGSMLNANGSEQGLASYLYQNICVHSQDDCMAQICWLVASNHLHYVLLCAMTPATPACVAKLNTVSEHGETPNRAPEATPQKCSKPRPSQSAAHTPTSGCRITPASDKMHPALFHSVKKMTSANRIPVPSTPSNHLASSSLIKEKRVEDQPSAALSSVPFDFRHASVDLSSEAQKIMDEVRAQATRIKEELRAQEQEQTNKDDEALGMSSAHGRKIAKPKGKAGRFSDVHMADFKKMDSIANHASAFRADPARIASTARSLKRTKSAAGLDEPESTPKRPSNGMLHTPRTAPPAPPIRSAKRVKQLDGSATAPRPATTREIISKNSNTGSPIKTNTQTSRSNRALMTPTKASLARASSLRSVAIESRIPSLARSSSLKKTGTPTRTGSELPTSSIAAVQTENSHKFRNAMATKFHNVKSILRRPQIRFSDDPAKIAAGTHLATPRREGGKNKPLPQLPEEPGTPSHRHEKHVNFSASTGARAEERLAKEPTTPTPAKGGMFSGVFSHASAVNYPTLVDAEQLPPSPTPASDFAQAKPRSTSIAEPGDFTFRSNNVISFSSPSKPKGASATIRKVPANDDYPAGSASVSQLSTLATIPHGLSNKKRKRDEGSGMSVAKKLFAMSEESENKENSMDVADEDVAQQSPSKKPRFMSQAGTRVLSPVKAVSAPTKRSPQKSKAKGVMTMSRLNALARPKERK
ncbi:hypothetical protein FH972_022779 [Carpinus fangiana]|uniref:Vacuolar membrane protease n=1 Tax=Carpinus fangiana TaxID=176857 RepID=A0A5N6KTM3_9ROSI|nr:hypothetical protein FH972_022779 [Carpinus fangiana]